MRLKRIVYVAKGFPKLSETFVANELVELKKRGIELKILSIEKKQEHEPHAFVEECGLRKLTCSEPSLFSSVVREFQPDLIHAHFANKPTTLAMALASEARVPFTFTAHHYDIYYNAPLDFYQRSLIAGAVITPSRSNAKYLIKQFGIPEDRIKIIPCGINIQKFIPNDENKTATPFPIIVCIARYAAHKNLGLFIRACRLLKNRGVPFKAVLIGWGSEGIELERLKEELDLHENVLLTGALEQSEVLNYLQKASVAVLSSSTEGLGVSLIEAAACGLPTVATNVGGIPDVVEDGVTGFLVPPNDPKAFADALEQVLENPLLSCQMGKNGRRRAENNFTLSRQVDSLCAVWQDVLSSPAN